MANTFNFEIDEEVDFSTRFKCTEDSTGLPTDLTGYTAEMHVREEYNGQSQPILLLQYTTANGGIALGGATGNVDVFIPSADTKAKTWNRAVYALYLKDTNNVRFKFMTGFFTILPSAFKSSQATVLT